jgi:hypothetical protein
LPFADEVKLLRNLYAAAADPDADKLRHCRVMKCPQALYLVRLQARWTPLRDCWRSL